MGTIRRRALVVGIDHYTHLSSLFGCGNDARAVEEVLKHDGDRATANFSTELICSEARAPVNRNKLRPRIQKLFESHNEIVLFYFAGHGFIESTGGYICASDSETGDDGVKLSDIVDWANKSKATNKIIVLDSCFSGIAGTSEMREGLAEIKTGVTILTASTENQYADEKNGSGIFTTLFVDALNGGAANLVGDITPGSIYAHIDQSLGACDQRPVFKTNIEYFVSLRKVKPPLAFKDLQRIAEFFPIPNFLFNLDPTFEPERCGDDAHKYPAPILENTERFAILQIQNRVGLVIPVDAPHMYHAAMNSKACKLTVLGEHYRRLIQENRISAR